MSWGDQRGVIIGLARSRKRAEERLQDVCDGPVVGYGIWVSPREARLALAALRLEAEHLRDSLELAKEDGSQEAATFLADRYYETLTVCERLELDLKEGSSP